MQTRRTIAYAPRTRALGQRIAALRGGCVGCPDCAGLCQALIEALSLPEVILKEKEA